MLIKDRYFEKGVHPMADFDPKESLRNHLMDRMAVNITRLIAEQATWRGDFKCFLSKYESNTYI